MYMPYSPYILEPPPTYVFKRKMGGHLNHFNFLEIDNIIDFKRKMGGNLNHLNFLEINNIIENQSKIKYFDCLGRK